MGNLTKAALRPTSLSTTNPLEIDLHLLLRSQNRKLDSHLFVQKAKKAYTKRKLKSNNNNPMREQINRNLGHLNSVKTTYHPKKLKSLASPQFKARHSKISSTNQFPRPKKQHLFKIFTNQKTIFKLQKLCRRKRSQNPFKEIKKVKDKSSKKN
jgi:hypothetical protein